MVWFQLDHFSSTKHNLEGSERKGKEKPYWSFIDTYDFIQILINRQQQRIPLSDLIPILALLTQQRPLILLQPTLQLIHTLLQRP